MGLEEGRYLERAEDGESHRVLVVIVAGAPAPARRRFGRAKPRAAEPGAEAPTVPLTTLTVVRPEPLGGDEEADGWLSRLRDDDEAIRGELDEALRLINRAVHAHRAAVLDPHLPDVAADRALAVRIGYGAGQELIDGRFSDAIDVPRSARRRRGEALRPQERVAAVMRGDERIPACELLVMRARADLDAGRDREAALQLRIALEALLAERSTFTAEGQEADLEALAERRTATGDAANAALAGEPSDAQLAAVTDTLALAERVLRRQRALGELG